MTAARYGKGPGKPPSPARLAAAACFLAAAAAWVLVPPEDIKAGAGAEAAAIEGLASRAPGLAAALAMTEKPRRILAVPPEALPEPRGRSETAGKEQAGGGGSPQGIPFLSETGSRIRGYIEAAAAMAPLALMRAALFVWGFAWLSPLALYAAFAAVLKRAVARDEFSWRSPWRIRSAQAAVAVPPAAAAATLILPVQLPPWALPALAGFAMLGAGTWLSSLQKEV